MSKAESKKKTLRTMIERLTELKPPPKRVRVVERPFDEPANADAALFEDDEHFLLLVQPGLPLPRLEERLVHEWAHIHDRCDKRPCGHRPSWGERYAEIYRGYFRSKNPSQLKRRLST